MRKIITIVLLGIHLFNLAGYSLMFRYLITQADTKIVRQLDDNNYSAKELVELKVPLKSPYITNSKDYERYDGSIDLNGIHYNYVKRKIYDDTLYLMCICNKQKMKLCDAKDNFQRLVTDVPSNKKDNESSVKKFNVTDEYNFSSKKECAGSATILRQYNSFFLTDFSPVFLQPTEQPPDSFC